MKFEKQFREAHPETVGETDSRFDLDNYCEFLESLVEEKLKADNNASAPLPKRIGYVCLACGEKFGTEIPTNHECG